MEDRSSGWVRAPQSGILRTLIPLGARVQEHQCLGVVTDPFGEREAEVHTPTTGIVIGRINLPLVNEGEALFPNYISLRSRASNREQRPAPRP